MKKTRQRVRSCVLFLSFLLFPVTQNYLSPYLIIDGALQGIVSGSFILFIALAASSLVLGRSWCSWICPGGAFCELMFPVNDSRVNGKRIDPIKYFIWVPWMAVIALGFVFAGGVKTVNPLHLTESGISIDGPSRYIIYYSVILLFFLPSLLWGRRMVCHSFCWMAPFMVLGRKLSNLLRLPSAGLRAAPGRCTSCGTCTKNCPMSLEVEALVASGKPENPECILCLKCVDSCPSGAVSFSFGTGRPAGRKETDRQA